MANYPQLDDCSGVWTLKEVNDAGLVLGVCTTSNVRSARAVAYGVLKDIEFAFVLAGDMVSKTLASSRLRRP